MQRAQERIEGDENMKKTIGIRSALLLTVIVLFAAALCLIFQTTSEVAVAEVYVNFLEYTNVDANEKAVITKGSKFI